MRTMTALVATLLSVTAAFLVYTMRGGSGGSQPFAIPTADEDQLREAAAASVFFAHQSVGYNLVDAVPSLYASRGLVAPELRETADPSAASEPGLQHVRIGKNGDPLGKIAEFDQLLRSGLGDTVDVAVLKLCYVDVMEDTDIDAVFTAYRDTFAALQRDYPDVRFIAATVPLTTERGPLGRVKAALGRGDALGPEHNVPRERINQLLRAEYSQPGTLFDIAAVQSTAPSGERVAATYEGQQLYAMYDGYSSDPGHLNPDGAAVALEAMQSVVATAVTN